MARTTIRARARSAQILFVIAASAAVALVCLLAPSRADARTLYVSNFLTDDVSAYTVAANGQLSPIAGSPFATVAEPEGVALTPDGRRFYVVGSGQIDAFRVAASGALSPVPGSPFLTGNTPVGVASSPDGKYLYVSSVNSLDIRAYAIAPNGALTPRGGPKLPSSSPTGIAVAPDGRHLYAGVDDGVDVFAIATNGTLSPVPGSPFGGPGDAEFLSFTPDGDRLYGSRRFADQVFGLAVAGNGTLSPIPGAQLAGSGNPTGIAMSPAGNRFYTANLGTSSVSGYRIAANGSLSTIAGSPFDPSGTRPYSLAMTPDGRRLYAPDTNSGDVAALTVANNGVLSPIPGSPFASSGLTDFQAAVVTPNQPPVASLSVSGKGATRNFDGSASTDADGTIASFAWDFGDGTTLQGANQKPMHTYDEPGNYTATLTLTDEIGCSTEIITTGQTAYCNGSAVAEDSVVIDALATVTLDTKKLKLSRKGVAKPAVSCPADELSGPCRGKLSLETRKKVPFKGKKQKVKLAKASFEIAPGAQQKVKLRLSKKKAKLVRENKKARKAVQKAKVSDDAGNSGELTKKSKLKPKRKG